MLSVQGLTEDDTSPEKSIIAVPQPPPPQQTVVATTLTAHAPQNTITIHGQAIAKAVRDTTHIAGPKFTLSKPISIIGTTNATPVEQIVYTTVAQQPSTVMQGKLCFAFEFVQ